MSKTNPKCSDSQTVELAPSCDAGSVGVYLAEKLADLIVGHQVPDLEAALHSVRVFQCDNCQTWEHENDLWPHFERRLCADCAPALDYDPRCEPEYYL